MSNQKEIRSLENTILVYSDYKSKVSTNHLTDRLRQAKIQELDNQISDCETSIQKLKSQSETLTLLVERASF